MKIVLEIRFGCTDNIQPRLHKFGIHGGCIMSYENINPIQQFNFQINRVLTYGSIACDISAVKEKTAMIRNFKEWEIVWEDLGKIAEQQQEFLRAAYAFRMAEFFLKAEDGKKDLYYKECIKNFYRAFDNQISLNYEIHSVPFEEKALHCIRMPAVRTKGVILVCGGYDSFIEEFVFQVHDLAEKNYDVILFEGPGQGRCLMQDMYFQYDFEKPTSAILDYFKITECAMVGISWGGYFALRSAAFEKRIKATVAYDVMDNGFEVMTHIFPLFLCNVIRQLYHYNQQKALNALVNTLRRKSILADWALSQGMYITGTKTPFDFYTSLTCHKLDNEIEKSITQDVLLLAGEKDHYIPIGQYYRLKERLINSHSLTCRLFTEAEGGEQHCQIGNHLLAVNYIIQWLDTHFVDNKR
jgi:pimeloyl-ACP methyl ester carboxylesterase